jgi:hypothetical protein
MLMIILLVAYAGTSTKALLLTYNSCVDAIKTRYYWIVVHVAAEASEKKGKHSLVPQVRSNSIQWLCDEPVQPKNELEQARNMAAKAALLATGARARIRVGSKKHNKQNKNNNNNEDDNDDDDNNNTINNKTSTAISSVDVVS